MKPITVEAPPRTDASGPGRRPRGPRLHREARRRRREDGLESRRPRGHQVGGIGVSCLSYVSFRPTSRLRTDPPPPSLSLAHHPLLCFFLNMPMLGKKG
jgi:hypothetical protein